MEEDISELINKVDAGESEKILGIENLVLTWKYLEPLKPNPKRVRVFYRHLKIRGSSLAKASICMVHGFAEHSGKLLNVAANFALHGFEVHLVDLRSYGLSGGARCGHDLIEFQQDIKLMLDQARSDIPCFLYGHSMGGLLVTTVLINNPTLSISGAIISAPLFETSSAEVDMVKECALPYISASMNELVLNSYIAPSCLSKDDNFLRKVFDDTKLMPLFSPAFAVSLLGHMKNVFLSAHKLTHPVIFYHGDADILTYANATEKVFRLAKSEDKTFKIIPGAYHEPHHDRMRDWLIPEMVQWAEERIKGLPFGKAYNFKTGLPGLPQRPYWKKVFFWVAAILYVVVALRIKIRINPMKIMWLWGIVSKIFWPLGLVVG